MPLTLPGASSFSFFKGPSLTTTTPLISNNEPVSIPALSTTVAAATASSMNFNNKTSPTTGTRHPRNNTFLVESNIDNDNTKIEKSLSLEDPVVPAERRARSVDAAINRSRRGSNCSSRASNKKSVWFKTFMLRLQQTFFRFSNESEDQVKAVDDDVFQSRTRSSVDAARDEPTNEEKDTISSSDSGNVGLLQPRNQGPCNVLDSEISDPSSSHHQSTSSVFEICAQTPRHKTKEPEVLRQVGRFTIVREREDFDTIIFDQCHCLQKPCKYSLSGGVHPPSPPELLSESTPHPPQTRQRITGQLLQHLPRNPSLTSRSGPPRYSFYSQPPSISSSSRRSLPCLCSSNNSNNNLMNVSTRLPPLSNTIPPASRTIRVMTTAANVTSSTLCRKILPTSASSPNLMNLRPKNENVWNNNNKLRPLSNANIHVNNGELPATVRTKKPSMVNVHQEFLSNIKHNSAPTPFSSLKISLPSKVSSHEPHATISSHSGRKFEVEWCSSSVASSNSSSSNSSSSESASSPASTSSVFSFASSPGTNSHSPATTLSRQRSSTLSSKHGRKFEVTVLSSDNDATTSND